MRRLLPDAPTGREEFLYFVLACNESVESVVNQTFHRTDPYIFSTEQLAHWTIENWSWAVADVVSCSQYINVLYSHTRILNREHNSNTKFSIAHFRKELPIYKHFIELESQYQSL